MKTCTVRLLIVCVATFVVLEPGAFAQRQLGKKKGPTSKLYVAESKGDSQIRTNDKVYTARQATAFDAPGTVIETKADSSTAMVFSNGVGMTVGQNSRVEINRFEQTPFTADRNTVAAGAEPSSSQSDIYLARGTVGFSTSQFASGSTMLCSTPLAAVNIRGGNLSIVTTDDETIISLLDGAATVFRGDKDASGLVLQAGEQVIIRRAPAGQQPIATISQIPLQLLAGLNEFVGGATSARQTVSFDVIEQKATQGLDAPSGAAGAAGAGGSDATQEIAVRPTVPATLPVNVVISADRLPGG